MFYCTQRGLSEEEAVALIVNGFAREVLQHLPMEFAVEAQKLVSISEVFKNIIYDLENNGKDWKNWYDTEKPEVEELPTGYSKLTTF